MVRIHSEEPLFTYRWDVMEIFAALIAIVCTVYMMFFESIQTWAERQNKVVFVLNALFCCVSILACWLGIFAIASVLLMRIKV